MKVALLTRAVYPLHGHGGLERHTAGLKRALERAGCEVLVFTAPPHQPGRYEEEGFRFARYRTIGWPEGKGFVILDRDTNYLMWSVRAAKALLSSGYTPDVVQADGGAAFGYAWARRDDAPPLVLHPHGMEEFKTTPGKRALYWPLRTAVRYAAKRAECVIAPDASMETEVREILSTPRVRVLPNAIDLDEVDKTRQSSEARASDTTLLLSVGRLEQNKGFVNLADALGSIKDTLPERWEWHIVGQGPDRETIEIAAHDRGIADHVRFAGAVSDDALFELYDRADLFVHPTLFEGSSMVTLEAMARGIAVVGTRVGGIPDKIEDGESGLLVPPGDSEALGQAIVTALADRARLKAWGERGRHIVETRFSWTARIEDQLALYQSLVDASQPSR